MAELTDFAGLTALHLGEGLDDDFLFRDRKVIDRLLRVGAMTHRHDGHTALADPPLEAVVGVSDVGGTLRADLPLSVAYTLIDQDGGETMMSPPVLVSTGEGMVVPTIAPTLEVDHTAGTLLANTYSYAVTVVDGQGGETALGPTATITVTPGQATNQIDVSGLDAILAETLATEWRLWRRVGSAGQWALVNQGGTASLMDDGSFCIDCSVTPPTTGNGTTLSTYRLLVNLPAALADLPNVDQYAIYVSESGTFESPCLMGTYPIAEAATVRAYSELQYLEGAPPALSLSLPGAGKIDPDTEVLGNWRKPVANAAALPAAGNVVGDVRITLDDFLIHHWDGDSWELPGGGGHVIQDEGVAENERTNLSFIGTGVSVNDNAGTDTTEVVIDGLPARDDVSVTALALASGASANLSMALGKLWTALKVVTNRPTRVRVYANAAYRAADANRAVGVDPVGDHGLLFEFVSEAGALSSALAPPVIGFNLEDPVTPDAAVRVTNLDAAPGDVTVTLTALSQEA